MLHRYGHQTNDDIVAKRSQRKRKNFLLRVEGQAQQLGSTTRNESGFDTFYAQQPAEVTADLARAQRDAIRTVTKGTEGLAVHEIILFDGTPVVRIDQLQRIARAILILSYDDTIGYTALHMVGRACHQEPQL